jgi:hypothetical protein
MGKPSFRTNTANYPKTVYSEGDAKPIVKTYLEGSRTFLKNLSTEVLEKEAREGRKVSGKVLIEKEKRPRSQNGVPEADKYRTETWKLQRAALTNS